MLCLAAIFPDGAVADEDMRGFGVILPASVDERAITRDLPLLIDVLGELILKVC